jgi:hypothetical protein
MPPQIESPRGSLTARPRRAAALPARRPAHAPATFSGGNRPQAAAAPLRDRGLSLFTIFTVAMFVMVGLAVLTAIVGRWWILVPVMVVDLAATAAVLASIARLLADGDDRAPTTPQPEAGQPSRRRGAQGSP